MHNISNYDASYYLWKRIIAILVSFEEIYSEAFIYTFFCYSLLYVCATYYHSRLTNFVREDEKDFVPIRKSKGRKKESIC